MMAYQDVFERKELKYLLTEETLACLLARIAPHLRPDEHARYAVRSVYYDTPDFALIRASLEKPVYKEKLRLRCYGAQDECARAFVELKKKFKGVVYKRRVLLPLPEAVAALSPEGAALRAGRQVLREIDFFLARYGNPAPRALIICEREAYAEKESAQVRLTLDRNIRCSLSNPDVLARTACLPLLPEARVLMEIKLPGVAPLWLSRALSELMIFPVSFSKYGMCYRQYVLPARTGALLA